MESKNSLKEKVRLCHMLKSQLQKKKSKLLAYKRKKTHVHKVLFEQNNLRAIESDCVVDFARESNTVVTFAPETQILNLSNDDDDDASNSNENDDKIDTSASPSLLHQEEEEEEYSDMNILFEEGDSFFEDSFRAQDKSNTTKDDSIVSLNTSFDIFSHNDVPTATQEAKPRRTSSPKLKVNSPRADHQQQARCNNNNSNLTLEDEDMFQETSVADISFDKQQPSSRLSTAILACFQMKEFNQMLSLPFVKNAKLSMDMDESLNILYLTIRTDDYLYLYKSTVDNDNSCRQQFSGMKLIWKRMISSNSDTVLLIHENNRKSQSQSADDSAGFLRLVVSEVQLDFIVLLNCFLFNNDESLINCLTVCLNLSQLTQMNLSSCFVANNDCLLYCSSDTSKNSSIIVSIDLPGRNQHEFRKLSSVKLNLSILNLIKVENSSTDQILIQDLQNNIILIRIDTKTGDILSKLHYQLIDPIDRILFGSAFSWDTDFVILSAFVQYKLSGCTRAELFAMQSFVNLPKHRQQHQSLHPIPISHIDFLRPFSFDLISQVHWLTPSVAVIVENKELHCRILDWVDRSSSNVSLSVTDELLYCSMWSKHCPPSIKVREDSLNSFVSLCFESGDIVLIKLAE